MAAEKRKVSREEYYRELSLLGVKGARRKRLRSEYFSILGKISGVAREQRALLRRVPYVGIVSKVIIYERVRELDRDRGRLLTQLRHIRITEIPALEEEIARELREFQQKKRPPPPPPPPALQLHRIKIRLYNMQRLPTPTGMFQGFFDVDALIDPETGIVDWSWWLTAEEIFIAKYHMVGYFKGMAKWRSPNDMELAYFDDPRGIPYEEKTVSYGKYRKKIPPAFIARAEALTVGELILGESSIEPMLVKEPEGVFVQRFMVIDADGGIKWDEIRNKFCWVPTETMINKVKEELKIA